MTPRTAVTVAGVVLLGGGCTSAPEEYLLTSDKAVVIESAADAVTWSDTVAIISVARERGTAFGPEGEEPVFTGRRIEVRIDDVVWSRADSEQPPHEFDTAASGWHDDGGDLIPIREERGVRLEAGKTYLAPVLRLFGAWVVEEGALEVVDGRVVAASQQDFPLAADLDGLTVAEAGEVLADARPDPASGPLESTTEAQLAALGLSDG